VSRRVIVCDPTCGCDGGRGAPRNAGRRNALRAAPAAMWFRAARDRPARERPE
jgi:hypothetical protein